MLSLNSDMNSPFLDDPYRTDLLPLRRVRRRFRQHVVTPIVFLVGALVAVHLGLAVSGVVKDARLNPGALYPNVWAAYVLIAEATTLILFAVLLLMTDWLWPPVLLAGISVASVVNDAHVLQVGEAFSYAPGIAGARVVGSLLCLFLSAVIIARERGTYGVRCGNFLGCCPSAAPPALPERRRKPAPRRTPMCCCGLCAVSTTMLFMVIFELLYGLGGLPPLPEKGIQRFLEAEKYIQSLNQSSAVAGSVGNGQHGVGGYEYEYESVRGSGGSSGSSGGSGGSGGSNSSALGFDLVTATRLARFSKVAYCENRTAVRDWSCGTAACDPRPGKRPEWVKVFYTPYKKGLQVVVAVDPVATRDPTTGALGPGIVVAFRGTTSHGDGSNDDCNNDLTPVRRRNERRGGGGRRGGILL